MYLKLFCFFSVYPLSLSWNFAPLSLYHRSALQKGQAGNKNENIFTIEDIQNARTRRFSRDMRFSRGAATNAKSRIVEENGHNTLKNEKNDERGQAGVRLSGSAANPAPRLAFRLSIIVWLRTSLLAPETRHANRPSTSALST